MFGPLWFLSLEILYFGLCFNKNISFIQKKKRKRKRKQRRVLKKLTVGQWNQEDVGESQPRRWGTTIEDVVETYTYFSLQIRRINLEIREKHLSKIHSAYMIYLSKDIQGNNKNLRIAEILSPPSDLRPYEARTWLGGCRTLDAGCGVWRGCPRVWASFFFHRFEPTWLGFAPNSAE